MFNFTHHASIALFALLTGLAHAQEPSVKEAELLDYLKDQDIAKFENNPWLKVKASSGNPESVFKKRAHHGYFSLGKVPGYIEADLGKPFKVEAIYVEDSTWEDFGAGKYEIFVYDENQKKFVPTEPASKYELANKNQKGHRKIFSFKPVTTSKIRLEAYEGRGSKPENFYIKKICVLPEFTEALKFQQDFLKKSYEVMPDNGWNAKWIWHQDTRYKTPLLKKDFTIVGEISEAKIQGNAKNLLDVRINSSNIYSGNGSPSFLVQDIAKYLKQGTNTVSVNVTNMEWPGGLILELLVKLKDGKEILIVSDGTWMAKKTNEAWQNAGILTQDICGRWNNKPAEEFKRENIGTLSEVSVPGSINAGDICKIKLSCDLKKETERPEDIQFELIDEKGISVLDVDSIKNSKSKLWAKGKQEIGLDFKVSRYIEPGEYALKLKIKGISFSRDYKNDCIGKIKVNPPSDPIKNAEAKVEKKNGVPALFINGKNVYPMFYIAWINDMQELTMMKDSGIHLYAVPTANPEYYWKDYGVYDLASYEKKLREIIDADPKAYIMIDLIININTSWWIKQHPDDECVLSDGKPSRDFRWPRTDSFGSETGVKDSCKMVYDIVSRLENSSLRERIIGYRFYKSVGGEWYAWYQPEAPFPDHSPAMKNSFKNYLKTKYSNITELQKAWNSPDSNFETAGSPDDKEMMGGTGIFRDLKKEQKTADYFASVINANQHYIEEVMKSARSACKGKKIFGLFYGYTFELWAARQSISGHMGLNRILNSGLVDFLCAPISYYMRYVGEPEAFFMPVDSLNKKGILYFDDSDFRLHLSTANFPHEHIPQDSISVAWRHFGVMLQKNYAFQWHGFGPWFICPAIREAFSKMSKLGDKFVEEENKTNEELQLSEKDRIAIIVSEKAPQSMTLETKPRFSYYLIPIQRESFPQIGAPFDMLLLEELLERKEFNYKAYIFLNAFSLTEAQRKIIKEKIAVNGNVLAWVYAPGIFKGQDYGEDYMKDITGISLKIDNTEGPLEVSVTNTANPLTSSCKTGDIFGNSGKKLSPRIYSDDASAEVLGTCPPEKRPGLVVKDMGTWKSVFIAAPRIPASVLRGICRLANVHLYSDKDLTIYPNNRYITIYPDRHMTAEIKFPGKVKLFDIINQKWVDGDFSNTHKLELLTDKPYIYKLEYAKQ